MKFTVVTYGTEGDTRPFAALCRGLMAAGHQAVLLADAGTLGSAQTLGVPTALAGDIRGLFSAPIRPLRGSWRRAVGFKQTASVLAKIANENAEPCLRTIVEAGEGSDAIVGAGLAAFGRVFCG